MIFYLFLCQILFIPLVYSNNTTVNNTQTTNSSIIDLHKEKHSNETKVTLLSEGGSLLTYPSDSALPKDKHTILTLDSELGKEKVKSVVARKGVSYTPPEPVDDNDSVTKSEKTTGTVHVNNSTASQQTSVKSNVQNAALNHTEPVKLNLTASKEIDTGNKEGNKTIKPTKPPKTSYDELSNMPVKSSPESIVKSQIQSPNGEIKTYTKDANSHPGMVMPIVITMLLVPMFAVLGYMALKRGQEAWKNRHYKRMDFLLDGMYND